MPTTRRRTAPWYHPRGGRYVSFLPKRDLSGDYRQLPYEKVDVIPEQKINHDVHLSDYHMSDSEKELFCTTDKCVVE